MGSGEQIVVHYTYLQAGLHHLEVEFIRIFVECFSLEGFECVLLPLIVSRMT